LVGATRVSAAVGTEVSAGAREVVCGWGTLVRCVAVGKGVGVREGMMVGVRVTVEVGLGVSEAVDVGAVEVGKGPKSAWAVIAMAVFVPFESFCASELLDGTRKANQSAAIKPINRADPLKNC